MDNQQANKIKWTEQAIADEIRRLRNGLGRAPRAMEVPAGFLKRCQQRFGSWNKTLQYALGEVTQARYGELTEGELLNIIRNFVIKYQRLPLRSEFDGINYPYFEAYTKRFGKRRWADVLALVDLKGIKYYTNKHGFGKVFIHEGVTYLSKEEYLIGKYLSDNGYKFEKEVPYGNTNSVFDFYLPKYDVYIEYYGIATPEYKERIAQKQLSYNGRKVLEIFKHDNTIKKLVLELQRL